METIDYIYAWLIYLIAGAALCWMNWRVIRKIFWIDLAYVMQATLMAVVFTPWYVLPDQEILAPAVIIFVMDIVTIETLAGIRALVPMAMAIIVVDLITIFAIAFYRLRRVKRLLGSRRKHSLKQN